MDDFDESYDQRRFRRVKASGWARVNFDGFWHNCSVDDLSGGGAFFLSRLQPPLGSNVLVQIRGVGMVRARVAHRQDKGFSVEFCAEDLDRDAVVDNLTLIANRGILEGKSESAEGSVAEKREEFVDHTLPSFEPSDGPSGRELLEPLPEEEGEAAGSAPRRHPLRIRTRDRN